MQFTNDVLFEDNESIDLNQLKIELPNISKELLISMIIALSDRMPS
jgi:hypothetical protein